MRLFDLYVIIVFSSSWTRKPLWCQLSLPRSSSQNIFFSWLSRSFSMSPVCFFFETHCPVLDSHLCSSLPAKGIYQLWYIDSIRLAILYSYNRKLSQSLSFARSWTTQTRVKNVWIIMTYITSTTLNPVRTV